MSRQSLWSSSITRSLALPAVAPDAGWFGTAFDIRCFCGGRLPRRPVERRNIYTTFTILRRHAHTSFTWPESIASRCQQPGAEKTPMAVRASALVKTTNRTDSYEKNTSTPHRAGPRGVSVHRLSPASSRTRTRPGWAGESSLRSRSGRRHGKGMPELRQLSGPRPGPAETPWLGQWARPGSGQRISWRPARWLRPEAGRHWRPVPKQILTQLE